MDEDNTYEDDPNEGADEAEATGEAEGSEDTAEEGSSDDTEEGAQGEADPVEAEAEPEPEPPAYIYEPPTGETPEMALLREKLNDPEIAGTLQAAIAAEVARATAAASVGQTRMTAIAAERPALWKAYGNEAANILAQAAPAQRAKPESVEGALLMAAVGAHIGKPTYARELAKYAALYNNESVAPAPKPVRTVIPAVQRPPSPSTGGQSRPMGRVQKELAGRFGLNARGIDELMEDLG